jgi:hypothetical protein
MDVVFFTQVIANSILLPFSFYKISHAGVETTFSVTPASTVSVTLNFIGWWSSKAGVQTSSVQVCVGLALCRCDSFFPSSKVHTPFPCSAVVATLTHTHMARLCVRGCIYVWRACLVATCSWLSKGPRIKCVGCCVCARSLVSHGQARARRVKSHRSRIVTST